METLIILTLLIISSHTYIAYICFILIMLNLVFYIYVLGFYFIALLYIIIYIGSIAVLFAYILMVLSLTIDINYGHIFFLFPVIYSILYSSYIFGTITNILHLSYEISVYNILDISYVLYTELILPIAILLFLAMFFVIKYL